jgi:PAS domain S-box-containing protein
VFARPEHPLALFLDDLQWLDAATLDLLEDLLTRSDLQHFMLIGAYRDNEVDAVHPLRQKLDAVKNAGAKVAEITLAPLAQEHLEQLIADALRCEPERAASLAQLVREKTGGNPFFVIQFVSSLAEEGMLVFDHDAARWSWDLERIHAKGYTDNVVGLMVGKLTRLPADTQNALRLLACLGNSAEITRLSIVLDRSPELVDAALWPAVQQELVERLEGAYRFAHDRVQEAAYSLIPEELRGEAHLRIGRRLAAHIPPEKREEAIFDIVSQLDRGAALITSPDEREQLAQLNLLAGKRAKASTAYASALTYLVTGATLLPEDSWGCRHELTFELELLRAECEFVTGAMAAADERLKGLSTRAANTVERASVACLHIDLYLTLAQSSRAIAVGLDYLRHLGIEWSPHPTDEDVRREYDRIWSQLGSGSIEDMLELPLMTDPASLATIDVLTKVAPAALTLMEANFHALAICWAANLSLERGNSDGSCDIYVRLGFIAGDRFGDYKAGSRFGKVGWELVERRGLKRFQARTYMLFAHFLIPYTQHVRAARDLLHRGFEVANKIGDLVFVGWYSGLYLIENLLASGDPLSEVQREVERGLAFAQKAQLVHVVSIIQTHLELVRTLRGLTRKFGSFDDEEFGDARFARNPNSALAEWLYCMRKVQAHFHAGDYASAIQAATRAQRHTASGYLYQVADLRFYSALSHAAVCDTADQREAHFAALSAHHRQLEIWAEQCPENFENRAALVGAEIARLEGRDVDAMRLYQQGIRSARVNSFVQNEALAYELAARFYAARGFDEIAHLYLRNARYGYLRWGADGKVRQLDEVHPHLRTEEPAPGPTSTIGTPLEQLDLATVIKVSQAVSSEIVLEKLIKTLMMIAVEHAGAERGVLILPHGEELRIAAEAGTAREGVEVQLGQRMVTRAELPESLLHYVIRTQESVILDDASTQNLFSQDEYVRQRRPRSVLCLPLVKQVNLVGILYLENSLAPRVFTPKRLAMLELLASQAAISLDHARLYADLGRLNAELTQENSDRRKAEEALRTSEERLQDIVDNTTAVIFVKDLDLHYLLVNSEFERRHQVQRDQIRGKTDFDIHPYEVAEAVRANDRQVIEAGVPIQFEEAVPSAEGERSYVSVKFLLRDRTGKPYAVCGIATDITESKRAEAMQAAIARERELFAQQRATELAKANEALRGCLDALASVPELDEFLGQVMAAITRQLGAVASTLRVLNPKQNTLTMELLYQDGRVMSPTEAKFPESWRSLSLVEQRAAAFLDQPTTVARILDPDSPLPEALRFYLLGLGIKTVLIIPLTLGGHANGQLSFRFTDERDFHPEELEIARALATHASLAIHLTRLAKSARQSAVLEERNQLAAEIHDALAQSFTGITMQLGVAREQLAAKQGDPLRQIQRANEIAKFGLAEARRSILSLRSSAIEESGLTTTLQRLVEHSNVAGQWRCDFRSDNIPEESLPPGIQHELLRFAQEAISNAVRHAKPTVVSVTLRWKPPDLILKVKDNGSGISGASLEKSEGFGLRNMRIRASQINGKLDIQTAAGRGTTIVLTVPIPS